MVALAQSNQQFSEADRTALRCGAFVDGLAVSLEDFTGKRLGPKVVGLTPWRHNLLFLYGSPFVYGLPADRKAVWQALWMLSPEYRLGSVWRFKLFCARWAFLPLDRTADALATWIKAQFLEAPAKEVKKNGDADDDTDPHWLAGFVLSMVQLGLPESSVLHTPYCRLLQYLAVMDERASGKQRPRFNRKRDAQAKAYMLAKRARLAAGKTMGVVWE